MKIKKFTALNIALSILSLAALFYSCSDDKNSSGGRLYDLGTGLSSRSISFENSTGEPGKGGQKASSLGIGRKGFPCKGIEPGETVELCNITGPGTINHIWMTGGFQNDKSDALRSIVIRAYWEDQEYPSIECPLGDFMGMAHAKITPYQSAVHSVGSKAALNIWLPMPFTKKARITFTNEGDKGVVLYYQIDYTVGDKHPENCGRLHVCFRRDNPTTLKNDFEILPERTGQGRYIGAVIGIRSLDANFWWGEGEIKIYKDGDKEFPTICGTGSEDYICLSYGVQETPYLYHGCTLDQKGFVSMYRWHMRDPIYWDKKCRITIQQIGVKPSADGKDWDLNERLDDWSCATFWYEPEPSAPLPQLPDLKSRVANIWVPEDK